MKEMKVVGLEGLTWTGSGAAWSGRSDRSLWVVFSRRVSTKGRATRRCRSEDVALIDRIASDLTWLLRDVAPRAILEPQRQKCERLSRVALI
ncbi:hypothetical protein F2Q69_00020688 [Brassica cretica]|uniref:Uncharacterized protein n=1 Tax=Brassica cretica TaxID=69181 RepID=A0A8S9Q5S7_BRACR|nr:hypothetical protein F2Q69_00020688 [Brassica cretica]